ncbi:MAG: 4-(cytidine 5'-diphospho)-2-C-methyl-D-erythritol kinase [Formosimonas sp.]
MNKYLSPAKINWFVHITGRRADGYHTLESIFQRIDWCDELRIEPRDDGQIVLSGDLSGTTMSDNLAYRAARALQAFSPLGANIHLTKHIPTGAGLGGGSSNAATVLLALNELWGLNLNRDALQSIGLGLGADVPFFVSGHAAAQVTGIGEILQPIELPARDLLLVKPHAHVATAAVFTHPDLPRQHPPLREWLAEGDNDLEAVTFALAPEVRAVFDALRRAAPDAYVRMSGSGATVFAAPRNEAQREQLRHWRSPSPDWHCRWVRTYA